MITRIPRSSFSANINNTAQTNEHQTGDAANLLI